MQLVQRWIPYRQGSSRIKAWFLRVNLIGPLMRVLSFILRGHTIPQDSKLLISFQTKDPRFSKCTTWWIRSGTILVWALRVVSGQVLVSITKEKPYSQENLKTWAIQRFHPALVEKGPVAQRIVKSWILSPDISEIRLHLREGALEVVPNTVIWAVLRNLVHLDADHRWLFKRSNRELKAGFLVFPKESMLKGAYHLDQGNQERLIRSGTEASEIHR